MNLMEAISYATQKHDGQKRKIDQTPYISHPYRVAMLLAQEQHPESVIIAGLLHDVVEDTDGTLTEIENKFGKEVSQLVFYASEPNKSLSWRERKEHTIATIKHAPLTAKLVVCADKVDNLTSILESEAEIGDEIWNFFKKGKTSQQWYYSKIYQSLIYGVEEVDQPLLFKKFKQLLNKFI